MKDPKEPETIADVDDADGSFLAELFHFFGRNKKWWMIPMIVSLLAFGVLLMLSGTAIAPFIYTLF